MRKEFDGYLKTIGITKVLSKRIEEIYQFFKDVCEDEITGIFLTEYIKEDGTREYENVWFFSEKYLMEAKEFVIKDIFDLVPIQKRVVRWVIEKENYDFVRATDKSRFQLKVSLIETISGDFKASKENCDFLKDIAMNYIFLNLTV